MKLISFHRDGAPGAGFIDGDAAVICAEGPAAESAVRDIVERGAEGMAAWYAMAKRAPRASL